jgi:hypothetical protein
VGRVVIRCRKKVLNLNMVFAEVAFKYGGASAGEVMSQELCSHRFINKILDISFLSMALLHMRCFKNKSDLSLPFLLFCLETNLLPHSPEYRPFLKMSLRSTSLFKNPPIQYAPPPPRPHDTIYMYAMWYRAYYWPFGGGPLNLPISCETTLSRERE